MHNIICQLTDLISASKVLDLGCGRGELLCQIVETFGCHGLGIDKDDEILLSMRKVRLGNIEIHKDGPEKRGRLEMKLDGMTTAADGRPRNLRRVPSRIAGRNLNNLHQRA